MSDALTAAQRVALAREAGRPNVRDYIDGLFTDFFEQKGDRLCGEDAAILLEEVGEQPVDVVPDYGPLGVPGDGHPLGGGNRLTHGRSPFSWRRSREARVSRIWARDTTASTKPCSSRYSARWKPSGRVSPMVC